MENQYTELQLMENQVLQRFVKTSYGETHPSQSIDDSMQKGFGLDVLQVSSLLWYSN